jgi:broad specificity phosphatase PhoE
MAPTIIFIRHAQAWHNLTKDYQIPDPALTDEGIAQCANLRESLRTRYEHLITSPTEDAAILASPMHRTLQTAQIGLGWLIEKGVKVLPDPDWQGVTAYLDHLPFSA